MLANGVFVSTFTFVIGVVLLGFRPGLDSVPSLALVVVVTVLSCTAFGMLLGSIGLRAKDFFFAANLAYFLMLLFCGVNIPLETLPGWMSAIGRCLPLTHGIAAARAGRDGRVARRRLGARSDGARDRSRLRRRRARALPDPRTRVAPHRRARRVLEIKAQDPRFGGRS